MSHPVSPLCQSPPGFWSFRRFHSIGIGLAALVLLGSGLCGRNALATITLQTPDPKTHDRFYVGVDKDFLGDPYDWSGVGRSTTQNKWVTMISESYFISATHFHPPLSDTVRLYGANDPSGQFIDRTVVSGTQIAGTDLWVGKLNTPINQFGEPTIAIYPVAAYATPGHYDNLEIFTMGLGAGVSDTSQRLGRNIINPGSVSLATDGTSTNYAYLYDYDSPGLGADESLVQGGDSGGPSMVLIDGSLALIGIHWFNAPPATPTQSGDSLIGPYTSQINGVLALDGESLTIVPEPGSMLLLAAGGLLLTLGYIRRQRRVA